MSAPAGALDAAIPAGVDLGCDVGPVRLQSPVLAASGTFGSGVEAAGHGLIDLHLVGGVVAKTVTREPRAGNDPPRMTETPAGMLNSIGLQNPGIDRFLEVVLPGMRALPTGAILNIAGADAADYEHLAARVEEARDGVTALELNLSCPNVSHGLDFGREPAQAAKVVAGVKRVTTLPVWVKLTPNVTRIADIAVAVADAGADALVVGNTVLGTAIDWRRRRPMLTTGFGGLSGPAIRPIALRCVAECVRATDCPVIGCGGITSGDDALEFIVVGAHAVQVGTASFAAPSAAAGIAREIAERLVEVGAASIAELRGTIRW